MCGRYANARRDADLVNDFAVEDVRDPELAPSWNVAPMQNVRIVLERLDKDDTGERKRQLRTSRWGLVPAWAKDSRIGSRMINARSESILEKPAFKNAARKRRAIVPADGYFEWQKLDEKGKTKQPYYLHAADGSILAFAALYEWWRDPSLPDDHPDKWQWTNTILTTTASDTLGHVHDRSPVIVPPDLLADWLNPAITDPDDVRELVAAMPEPHLAPTPVGKAVGSVRNNGPQLIEPIQL
ncbi:SOS response-associated peptidase [Georgenia yuyongxinii]|uniref:Abasic site processing protein n=1 Tax=Georgenia yuyongxinii TaxID=2589797 RepID=A0A552WUZ2_9MICO|nr:SOS response-associated peptidase [Georgenia yuyongxinii]TRW46379.1 SOS response-associated peptidase [Georgenia yuyongxinii]